MALGFFTIPPPIADHAPENMWCLNAVRHACKTKGHDFVRVESRVRLLLTRVHHGELAISHSKWIAVLVCVVSAKQSPAFKDERDILPILRFLSTSESHARLKSS